LKTAPLEEAAVLPHLVVLLSKQASRNNKESPVSKPRVRVACVVLAAALGGCGGGGDGAARLAAVQKALDAHPPAVGVPRGKACEVGSPVADAYMDPDKLSHVKEVKVTPDGTGMGIGMAQDPCYKFTWDSSVTFGQPAFPGEGVALGRYIVDKVGDDETVGSGQAAPFRAHFEATGLGKELIAAGLATLPQDVPNGHATITKDADGNFVAQTQLQ
jgi:hypothetical protein